MIRKSSIKPNIPRMLSGRISNGDITYAIAEINMKIIRKRYANRRESVENI